MPHPLFQNQSGVKFGIQKHVGMLCWCKLVSSAIAISSTLKMPFLPSIIQFSSCCSDFGFMRAQGLSGECVRDPSVPTLAPAIDSCGDGVASYTESSGYRKVAGDVCSGGIEDSLGPVTVPCEGN